MTSEGLTLDKSIFRLKQQVNSVKSASNISFSSLFGGIFSILAGVAAAPKSLRDASTVVLSLVRRLRMQEINTRYGSRLRENTVTTGTMKPLTCSLIAFIIRTLPFTV